MAMANLQRGVGNLFSNNSHGTNNVNKSTNDVVYEGNLAKRKNNKTRYFVLRREINKDNLSRLEYYESKKKYDEGRPPKKKFLLKSCSMINRNCDEKCAWMVTLYFSKHSVSFIARNEADMNTWCQKLTDLMLGTTEENPTREYRHVWQVNIQERSSTSTLDGQQFMCLTNKSLSFVKNDNSASSSKVELKLCTIRRCGHVHQFFFIELGCMSGLGSGLLWMTCEDPFIARNMNEIVGNAMNHKGDATNCVDKKRYRTTSDAQRKAEQIFHRSRTESVPNVKSWNRNRSRNQQSFGSPGSNASADSSSDEDPPHVKPHNDIQAYLKMTPKEISKAISPLDMTNNWRVPNDDDSEYVMMNEMDPVDPTPSSYVDTGTGIPILPLSGTGVNIPWNDKTQLPSPSDSRSSLSMDDTVDGYTPMMPPTYPLLNTSATSPYLSMGRMTDKISIPIPINSTDGDPYFEMSPNSGSSSITSGTLSSDQRNTDQLSERDIGSGGEDLDSLEMRPIRTSSVGSKSEHSKRKTSRLEAVTVAEPARVRAFSVGSHVWGRTGGSQPHEPTTDNLGELFPSIKETGKRAKNKSSSVPMLVPSLVSRSCPGTTPGSYFRGFLQGRNQQFMETDKMEIDLSKNNSYDSIPGDEKERKTSKERLLHTLRVCRRPRSESKSSGTSKCSEGESTKHKRLSECDPKEAETTSVTNEQADYCKLDYCPSSQLSKSDPSTGYVPMYAPSSLILPTTQNNQHQSNEVSPTGPSSLNLSDLRTPYVDMTQGSNLSSEATASSSSLISGLLPPQPFSSQEQLSSPTEDFMSLDLQMDGESPQYKGKKGGKRKSFKESAKRKKADSLSGRGDADSPDCSHKSKTSNALSTLTNFISRKPNGSKAPLSPQGNLLTKANKDSTNPFFSLSRSICKNSRDELQSDKEDTLMSGHRRIASFSSRLSPPILDGKYRSGSMDMTAHILSSKKDDKMLFDPVVASKLFEQSDTKLSQDEKSAGDYMNLNLSDEATSGSLPSLKFAEVPDYMNMHPGKSSLPLSSPATKEDAVSSKTANEVEETVAKADKNSYVLMAAHSSKNKVNFSNIARRPVIPATLLACQSSSLGLEKLSISDEQRSYSSSERSRSHSGPDGGIYAKNKDANVGRPSSACSSPISFSPTTSPTHGSVSSLSEGGLSSASSTCTVINVGLAKQAVAATSTSKWTQSDSSTLLSNPPESSSSIASNKSDPASLSGNSSSNQSSGEVSDYRSNDVNYVCLDLLEGHQKQAANLHPKIQENIAEVDEDNSSNYVAIDFTKSEGLRNTTLARDANRPH